MVDDKRRVDKDEKNYLKLTTIKKRRGNREERIKRRR